jgi:hypothetical protein
MGRYPFEVLDTTTVTEVTPSGDTTGITDTANITTALASGACSLAPGEFYLRNLLVGSYQELSGSGKDTILNIAAGTTGYGIALAATSTVQASIKNLTLNCGSVCGGILINNVSEYPDPQHLLCDLLVLNANGDAYHLTAGAENRISRCLQYGASGYGFYIGANFTDSRFTDCTSGVSGLHGWYVAGWNNDFKGCKGFYAGYTSSFDTAHSGWYLTAGHNNTFHGCSGQQNALHGMDMQSAVNCTVTACEFDNNGNGAAVTGVGINTNSCTVCAIIGCTGANDGALTPGGNQAYGFAVAGMQTGTMIMANTLSGTSGIYQYVSGGGYTLFQQSYSDLTQVETLLLPLTTLNGGTITAYSAPIITGIGAVSGTAVQLSDKSRDYVVYLECTTPGTATTIGIGHTSAADDVLIMNDAAISAGVVSFRLPAGWYFAWTGTTTAFGNQNAVGC